MKGTRYLITDGVGRVSTLNVTADGPFTPGRIFHDFCRPNLKKHVGRLSTKIGRFRLGIRLAKLGTAESDSDGKFCPV